MPQEVENIVSFRIEVENRFNALWDHNSNIEQMSDDLGTIIKDAAEMTNDTKDIEKDDTYSKETVN